MTLYTGQLLPGLPPLGIKKYGQVLGSGLLRDSIIRYTILIVHRTSFRRNFAS